MLFGRTKLRISGSKAKADGEVRLSLNPQKPSEKLKKLFFRTEFFYQKKFRRRKMKCRKSPEKRFDKFSWRTDVISKGKRPFEIPKNFDFFRKLMLSTGKRRYCE